MSIRLMSQVWELDLPISEKMVLLVIADHADDEGRNAWPSLGTVARKASLSIRQVRRLLRGLEERGFLSVEQQAGGTRDMRDDRRPNRYTVVIHNTWDGGTPTTSRDDVRADIDDARADIHDTHGRTPMSAKPSLEPPLLEPPLVKSLFDAFWGAYPRRTAKGSAEKAWKQAVKVARPEVIIAAAAAFAGDPNREPQYTPHPATWLNQRRWEDDALPVLSVKVSGARAYIAAANEFEGLQWELEGAYDA